MLPISTSLAGPLHLAHPSEQGAAVRTLLARFRRSPSSSSAAKGTSSFSGTLKKRPASYAPIECTLETTDASTYTPPSASSSSCYTADLPPPPPYTASPPHGGASEEDLVVLDDTSAETLEEAKQRRKAEKLERKRRELIEADKRMGEALKSYGW
ncbi:hypothetical protein JCM10207_000700 [Rhodosporidiobolus poonsookiae]